MSCAPSAWSTERLLNLLYSRIARARRRYYQRRPYLRRRLELSDGNLSRHLDVLIRAGLIEASKDSGSGRSRTWLRLTRTGQAALRAELRVMRSLLAIVDLD